MTDPLPIDSPRWRTFAVRTGHRQDLPRLLRSLSDAPQVRVIGEPAFADVTAMLFQDFECADAAVPAIPHLVGLAGRAEGADRGELSIPHRIPCRDVGRTLGAPGPPPGLDAALRACEPVAIQYFLATDLRLLAAYYAGLTCVALTRNPLGQLFRDNYIPHSTASTRAVCPNRDLEFEVAAYDTGLVVPRPKAAWSPPDPPVPLSPPQPPEPGDRDPNPCGTRCRGDPRPHGNQTAASRVAPPLPGGPRPRERWPQLAGESFCCILPGRGIARHQRIHRPGHRYYHASDQIACPDCKARFRFANRWWRLDL